MIKTSNSPNKRTLSQITPSSSNNFAEDMEKVSSAQISNIDVITDNTEHPKKKTASWKNKKMKTDRKLFLVSNSKA